MHTQAKDFGVSFVTDEIKEVDFSGEVKTFDFRKTRIFMPSCDYCNRCLGERAP